MSLFKRICSVFTSSVEDEASEQNNTNKVETNPSTVEKTTNTPDNDSDDMISKYVFDGEIKSGNKITVSDGEVLVIIKDGAIIDLLQTGIYILNDASVSNFASGTAYVISLKESSKIRWGTAKPINFTDDQYGELSLRLRGTYSYNICDVVKFVTDYMNCGLSVNDYTINLLINAVEKVVDNCNVNSYLHLPTANVGKLLEDELRNTGINFKIKLDMITPTEESKEVIKQAMQNVILNNQ